MKKNQFSLLGGGEFTQPLVNDNAGGLLLSGTQITDNRFVLAFDAAGNPGPAGKFRSCLSVFLTILLNINLAEEEGGI